MRKLGFVEMKGKPNEVLRPFELILPREYANGSCRLSELGGH